jgi:hypothetical protein
MLIVAHAHFLQTPLDWQYQTVPQKNGKAQTIRAGRLLGGRYVTYVPFSLSLVLTPMAQYGYQRHGLYQTRFCTGQEFR